MLSFIPMLSIALSVSRTAPGSQPYHWKSVVMGARGSEARQAVVELVSPREGAHLISGFQGAGGFTHWDLNRTPTEKADSAKLGDVESMSAAIDCSLVVVRAGKGSSKSGDYTFDGGAIWKEFATEPPAAQGGSIVFNSTAQVIVWSTGGSVWRSFDFGKSWDHCKGLEENVELVADGVTPTRTYALSGQKLFSSDDTAGSFQSIDSVGLPSEHGRMRATDYQVGDLWIPSRTGLFHSTDAGKFFQKLPHVDSSESVGFGKAAPGKSYPTIFITGKIDHSEGVFRSDDAGQTWTLISKPGEAPDGTVTGDPRIFGRVYLGTPDRGILYGDPS